jgi:DNA-binding XRE family transcriptional regulator
MKSQSASLKPTVNSALPPTRVFSDLPTSTSLAKVIYASFEVPPQLQAIPGAIDVDDLVTELEQSPASAAAIAEGRQWVAETFYEGAEPSVAQLRLKKGWSQAELARRAETSQPYIARLELGKVDPQISTVRKLAIALGIKVETMVHAISREYEQ